MKEQFEKWVMVASSGNADLTLNIHGEYDSPETSGFYELYKLARVDISQALTDMAVLLANAESKCRELAAENAEMRSSIDATIGWQESTDPENGESVRMLVDIKTPATDAFLAEVRAQGVEMAACALDDVNQFNYANMLDDLAQKIRKEAAQ